MAEINAQFNEKSKVEFHKRFQSEDARAAARDAINRADRLREAAKRRHHKNLAEIHQKTQPQLKPRMANREAAASQGTRQNSERSQDYEGMCRAPSRRAE